MILGRKIIRARVIRVSRVIRDIRVLNILYKLILYDKLYYINDTI